MTKRILTFLVAFLATLSGAVWGQDQTYTGTIDISGSTPTITSETDDISVDGNHIEISGDGNYLIKGDGTAKDYYIETGGDPTITLQDVYLKHEGDPIVEINITGGGDINLILIGKNIFETDGMCIKDTELANITITDQSTGSLTLKGETGFDGDASYPGSISVNGGTLIFDTTDDAIDGPWTLTPSGDFSMNGNGVVITNKPFDCIDFDKDNIKGIFFDNSSAGNNGKGYMYGNVTLNSPLDLTDNDQSAILDLQNGTLTVGENGILNAEYQDIRNGKISGFGIKYDANRISDCTSKDKTVPTNYNFYPTTAEVTLGKALTCSAETSSGAGKHQFLGWVYNNKVYAAESTITMNETAKTYVVDEYGNVKSGDFVTLQGAWAVEEISLTINNYVPMTDHPLASSSDIISYETVTEGLPSGIKCENGKFSGTANLNDTDFGSEESKVYTVTVPITAEGISGKTATVKITVNKTLPDLSNADVSIKAGQSYIYDGNKKEAVEVKVNGNALREGIHYVVTYTWKKNETDSGTEVKEVKDAGTYTITKIEAGDQATGTYDKTLPTETITVSPRELNLQINDQEIKLNETIATPSSENIEVRDNQSDENDYFISSDNAATITYSGTLTGTTDKVGEHELSKGTDFAIASITVNGKDVTHNYTLGAVNAGTLTVKKEGSDDDPINPGNPDEDNTEIVIGTDDEMDGWTWDDTDNRYERTYDGVAHPITSVRLKYQNEKGETAWETLSLEDNDFSVSYNPNEAVKNYNENGYTATLTITGSEYYSGEAIIKLFINKATFTVSGKNNSEITVKQGDNINNLNAADYITITGVNGETPTISGTLTPNEGVSTAEKNETGIENAFSFDNVEVENSTNCLLSNYNEITTWPQIKLIVGPITINPDTDGSGDDGDEVIGGEDADGDGTFPSDGDIIILATGDAEVKNNVYNGSAHTLALLKIGDYTLAEKTDYSVSYSSNDEPSLNEAKLPFHAATYSAEITLNDDSPYELEDGSKKFSLDGITIAQRPMMVSFVKVVSSVEDLNDINKLVQFEEMAGNRGLVDGEEPTVEAEVTATDLGDGHYQVTIPRESFKISTNEAGKFYLSDYLAEVDFNGDGTGDADITDDNNDGEGDIDDGDGIDDEDIVIEVTVDPDGSDEGGQGTVDIPKYYNIYEDEICEGVTVEFSRDVVREGQSVLVTVKAEEGFDATKLALQFKRSLFGSWEDLTLTPTENPNEYIIKNIYTDIYVRAEGAVPTGIESIDGVKVYAKDGSLFVQTPQLENVTIVTITGAIVKSEQQVGLKQYTGLQRGIYVVRVGEQVFKVRN